MSPLGEPEDVVRKEKRHDAPLPAWQVAKRLGDALTDDEDPVRGGIRTIQDRACRQSQPDRNTGKLQPLPISQQAHPVTRCVRTKPDAAQRGTRVRRLRAGSSKSMACGSGHGVSPGHGRSAPVLKPEHAAGDIGTENGPAHVLRMALLPVDIEQGMCPQNAAAIGPVSDPTPRNAAASRCHSWWPAAQDCGWPLTGRPKSAAGAPPAANTERRHASESFGNTGIRARWPWRVMGIQSTLQRRQMEGDLRSPSGPEHATRLPDVMGPSGTNAAAVPLDANDAWQTLVTRYAFAGRTEPYAGRAPGQRQPLGPDARLRCTDGDLHRLDVPGPRCRSEVSLP